MTCQLTKYCLSVGNRLPILVAAINSTLWMAGDTVYSQIIQSSFVLDVGGLTRVSRSGGDQGWPALSADTNPLKQPLR